MTPEDHDHRTHIWQTRSTHGTLEGLLRYQHCPCGLWRLMAEDREVARVGGAAGLIADEPADRATGRPAGDFDPP